MLTIDTLLNPVQKGKIVEDILKGKGITGPLSVRFKVQHGWDFKVSKDGKVVWSVPLSSERFGRVVERCVRALYDIKHSNCDSICGKKEES